MKLTPITTSTEPSYPTYRPTWRKLAAALAVGASLWLPACGEVREDTVAVPGRMPPANLVVGSDEQKPPEPEIKPPDSPALSQPDPRIAGTISPVEPPPEPRVAGGRRPPEQPKAYGR